MRYLELYNQAVDILAWGLALALAISSFGWLMNLYIRVTLPQECPRCGRHSRAEASDCRHCYYPLSSHIRQ